jgi:hypothetical protein
MTYNGKRFRVKVLARKKGKTAEKAAKLVDEVWVM